MLTILLGLLSSAGFGSIVGLAGGLINRVMDYKFKAMDNDFLIQKMDKEREYMKDEYANRIQIATTEKEAQVESAGYNALAASYSFANTSKEDGVVDTITKLIRPLLTLAFFFFSVYIFYRVSSLINSMGMELSHEQILRLYVMCIEWALFQAGTAIGWWFAMRPARSNFSVR
jgi:hypothetical protein